MQKHCHFFFAEKILGALSFALQKLHIIFRHNISILDFYVYWKTEWIMTIDLLWTVVLGPVVQN